VREKVWGGGWRGAAGRDENKIHPRGKLERAAVRQFRFANQLICGVRCMLPSLPEPLTVIRNWFNQNKKTDGRLAENCILTALYCCGVAAASAAEAQPEGRGTDPNIRKLRALGWREFQTVQTRYYAGRCFY
jgi:hypothetical protein